MKKMMKKSKDSTNKTFPELFGAIAVQTAKGHVRLFNALDFHEIVMHDGNRNYYSVTHKKLGKFFAQKLHVIPMHTVNRQLDAYDDPGYCFYIGNKRYRNPAVVLSQLQKLFKQSK